MPRKLFKPRKNEESGFTLVELLVVILIIGILAAIAIPVFLNQRQRANDAAVESDVRNVATAIESQLVSSPNASTIEGASESAPSVTVEVADTEPETVPLSDGVNIEIEGYGQSTDGSDLHANGYKIYGWHDNGRQYNGTPDALVYDSALGGFQLEPGAISAGGSLATTPDHCFDIDAGGYLTAYNIAQEGCTSDVVIPSEIGGRSVIAIWTTDFRDNNLTSVVIPEGITRIGDGTFRNNNLTSVIIPNSVTSIGNGSFRNNNLTSVVIPEGITRIGDQAFRNNNLTSVELPAHTAYIETGIQRSFDDGVTVTRR